MKGILEFNLPEEQDEFKLAQDGPKFSSQLDELDEYLRKRLKYEDLKGEQRLTLEGVRSQLGIIRND